MQCQHGGVTRGETEKGETRTAPEAEGRVKAGRHAEGGGADADEFFVRQVGVLAQEVVEELREVEWASASEASLSFCAVGPVSYTHLTLPTIYSV